MQRPRTIHLLHGCTGLRRESAIVVRRLRGSRQIGHNTGQRRTSNLAVDRTSVRPSLEQCQVLAAKMTEENPFARLFTKQASPNAVELAVLQPDAEDATIRIELTNADPDDTTYECISYDRSKGYGTTDILVDGQSMLIPKPLAEALKTLRKTHRPETVWADLLVGKTAEERSKQAAIAKRILEKASSTVVWLGQSNQHTKAAFDIIQEMANRCQQATLHSGLPENLSRSTPKQLMDFRDHLLTKGTEELQPSNADVWSAVDSVLSASYFWSVQSIPDIVLAKNAVLTSGDSTVSWSDFILASRAAPFIICQQLQRQLPPKQAECFELTLSLEVSARRRRDGETLELLPMIQSSSDCAASDSREIVFAMLPISTPSGRTKLPGGREEKLPTADYTKDVKQVFAEAAKYIIHERQDLLLWWTERPPRGRKISGMPSWVPDWTSPNPKTAVKVMPTSDNGMRAWWDHLAPPAKRITVDEQNALHVQAHALDRVVSVSPIFTQENCRRLCLTEWQALPSVSGESLDAKVQKMFRTLLFNQAGVGASLRDNAAPHREMWVSLQSVLAEERILELLGCTQEELMTRPELIQRAKSDPQMNMLGPQTGKSQAFEQLLRANALGRRFFRTASGNTGMTAIEELPPGEKDEREGQPMPKFDAALSEPLGRMMLQQFQTFLAQRDPNAAQALSMGLNGTIPGQRAPGVRSGDLVVALVGGFQPYVLRPADQYNPAPAENASQTLEAVSKYVYVGDCYLHGVMDGEPFKVKGWFGSSWNTNVKLVDVSIV
jgi:hypothetical protein